MGLARCSASGPIAAGLIMANTFGSSEGIQSSCSAALRRLMSGSIAVTLRSRPNALQAWTGAQLCGVSISDQSRLSSVAIRIRSSACSGARSRR